MRLAALRLLTGVVFTSMPQYAHAAPDVSLLEGAMMVMDGDSLLMGDAPIRLQGIDAPEYSQTCVRDAKDYACGDEAKSALSQLVRGQTVRCEVTGTDHYQRHLAHCYVGHVNINARMVELGHALAYRRYSKRYIPQEEAARQQRRGMHAGSYMLPWEWRRQHPR